MECYCPIDILTNISMNCPHNSVFDEWGVTAVHLMKLYAFTDGCIVNIYITWQGKILYKSHKLSKWRNASTLHYIELVLWHPSSIITIYLIYKYFMYSIQFFLFFLFLSIFYLFYILETLKLDFLNSVIKEFIKTLRLLMN